MIGSITGWKSILDSYGASSRLDAACAPGVAFVWKRLSKLLPRAAARCTFQVFAPSGFAVELVIVDHDFAA
jgi:hypothetical protein